MDYGREYIYPMLALLYGLYFDVDTENYCRKDKIIKTETNAEIMLGIFEDKSYCDISAVIYSSSVTLGKLTCLSISEGNHSYNMAYLIRQDCKNKRYLFQKVSKEYPEDVADGIFVFHNPNAKHKLPQAFFSNIAVTQFFFENEQLKYVGNATPIVSRINISKFCTSAVETILVENVRKYNRLNFEDFYDGIK